MASFHILYIHDLARVFFFLRNLGLTKSTLDLNYADSCLCLFNWFLLGKYIVIGS